MQKRLFLIPAILVIAVIVSAIVFHGTKKREDVSEGMEELKRLDNKSVIKTEKKINTLHRQEEVKKALEDKNYKSIFDNSVIIGDSIVKGFSDYGYLNESSVIYRIGVNLPSKDIDEDIEQAKGLHPHNVFLYYGNNDVEYIGTKYDEFKELYAAMLKKVEEALPESEIYIMAILPSAGKKVASCSYYSNMEPYNRVLKEISEEYDTGYIDSTELVKEEYFEPDGSHFVAKFYPGWIEDIINKSMLKE